MDVTLTHYCAEPLGELRRGGPSDKFDYKPKGLWAGVGEAWREWCESENFHLDCLRLKYEVKVHDWSKVLVLDTVEATRAFCEEYGQKSVDDRSRGIDWQRVMDWHTGILITPYHYMLRYDYLWYYTWDVPSGCFWDPSILTVKKVLAVDPVSC